MIVQKVNREFPIKDDLILICRGNQACLILTDKDRMVLGADLSNTELAILRNLGEILKKLESPQELDDHVLKAVIRNSKPSMKIEEINSVILKENNEAQLAEISVDSIYNGIYSEIASDERLMKHLIRLSIDLWNAQKILLCEYNDDYHHQPIGAAKNRISNAIDKLYYNWNRKIHWF